MSQYMMQSEERLQPDNLVAGCTQLVSRTFTLAGGQGVLARGTLMGMVGSTGKLVVSTTAANDGSQNPVGILYDQYDTTGGDVRGGIHVAGEFNPQSVVFGAGWTAANAFPVLRDAGIYLKPVVGLSGQDFG